MQQNDSDFFPLSYTMPNTVRKFADQDIYVKKDDLGENFDKLRDILRDNFLNMQTSGIELKKGFHEKNCNNVNDINGEKNVYFVIFPTGERISFSPSCISASNGANITSKNARNLYADQNFETKLTTAIETGDPQPLFGLLNEYSVKDRFVNNAHTRRNLYKKTQDNAHTTTYTPVEQNYNMENFYQNAVDNYKRSPEARTFEIRDYENRSRPGGLYYEYEYDPANMCIRIPDKVGRAQVYQDIHEDNLRKSIKQKYLQRKPILQYDPWFDYYIRDITFPRPSYYVEYGSYLVPVYR